MPIIALPAACGPHPVSFAPCRRRLLRHLRGLLATLALILAAPAIRADEPPVTDAAVEKAISRAVTWIKKQRKSDLLWEQGANHQDRFWAGDSALAILALLYAGEDPRSEEMARNLDWLASQTLNGTYVFGTRAHVFALTPGKKYSNRLKDDLDWLVKAVHPRSSQSFGAYGYTASDDSWADNSNSQYGVLGVWMATEAGLPVPENYWGLIEDHWLNYQRVDGGWGYQLTNESSGSMTAAGLATMYVLLDRFHAGDEGTFDGVAAPLCGKHKKSLRVLTAIQAALDWLGREFTPDNPKGDLQWKYYYLYGVERAGRASGRKYFRQRDWFRVGAAELLQKQKADGSWEELRNTCFALMFLCHGRAPVFFNKLEHGEDWSNKLRDVAGATRYAQRALERLLNWQIVPLDGPLEDLLEAPILYFSGHTAWTFTDQQAATLHDYCQRGGLLLGVACCSKPEFTQGFRDLAQRIFPEYPLRPVTTSHPLLNGEIQYEIKNPPELLEVHNGVRTLMLLSTQDICAPWNQYRLGRWENAFQLACNIYLYATDKTTLRSRLEGADIPVQQVQIQRTIQVARIKYKGRWDIEPAGWTRLGAYLNNTTASRLLVTSGVALDSPDLQEKTPEGRNVFDLAVMSGVGGFELSEAELAGLRKYLTAGGTLWADAACGAREFTEALEKQIGGLLKAEPVDVPADAFLITGKTIPAGVSLEAIGYRRNARREAGTRKIPRLKVFELGKRPIVIYSALDVTTGLLGTNVYNCRGYDPESCLSIMRNVLLYAQLSPAQKDRARNGP